MSSRRRRCPKVPEGQDGAGQRLLPVEQTLTPVGEDLIRDVMRRPYRERFAIILNEFGAGLAGRGKDLRKVIRGANPALRELDKVLKILADQNRLLADGARSGDLVLAEWAKKRKNVSNLIVQANIAAQATAEERANLEKNFETFPEFLRELKPTMAALGAMSEQMTPVARDLGAVGTDVSRILRALGPFSRAGIPAFQTLGDTADVGSRALQASQPTIEDLGDFTSQARSLTSNLSKFLTSFRDEDGVQRLMDVIYYVALSTNGYDQFGHYLRTTLLAGLQLAGHRREPGLHGELHRRREQRTFVQAEGHHAARPHPRGREPRQGDAPVPPAASEKGKAPGSSRRTANGEWLGAGTAADRCAPAVEAGHACARSTAAQVGSCRRLPPRRRVMSRRRGATAIASNPVLVGVATTLVIVVAIFLAYNANAGLPWVPTYRLTAEVPVATSLVKGNEARIGGLRVGVVDKITPVQNDDGSVMAKLDLKLETRIRPLPIGLDDHGASAVGAGTEVHRDHARRFRPRLP